MQIQTLVGLQECQLPRCSQVGGRPVHARKQRSHSQRLLHHLALLAWRLYLQLNLTTDCSCPAGYAIDQVKRQTYPKNNLQNP